MRYLVAFVIGIGALFGVNAFAGIFSMPRPWNSLSMGATVGITMVVVLLIWELVKPSNKGAAPAKPAMSDEERAKARAERRSQLAAEAGVSPDDTTAGDTEAGDTVAQSETEDKGTETKADSKAAESTESTTEGQTAVPAAEPADDTPVAAAPPMRSANEDDTAPEADESSIEAEPDDGDDSRDQQKASDVAHDEPGTLDESNPLDESKTPDEPKTLNESDTLVEPETLAPDEYDEGATGSSLESPPTGEPGISVDALEDAESADTDGAADDDPVGDGPESEEPDSKR
ncbi:hypothetical protein [Brevibacterium aurantiacum]|uniref:Uncharacterized protein n=1 Tax=Brevibacterium aurantiacum TaxID=273384 RepID=A0A2H1HNK2_BREAU|nr:hypothetical protein [Brevibacterium aurantiacum]SMX64495.1 hypothetical protein BAURA63_00413 [Brevibacterium aurantiacum]